MPRPKPPYAAAFRQQMVELVRADRNITDLAREFDCNASSIQAWVKAANSLGGSGTTSSNAPLSVTKRQELIELRPATPMAPMRSRTRSRSCARRGSTPRPSCWRARGNRSTTG